MKLTSKEAREFVKSRSVLPFDYDAMLRSAAHSWTFDPHGDEFTLALRRFHEQHQVLYAVWTDFELHLVMPSWLVGYPFCCFCCASRITEPPYCTARNYFSDIPYEICCDCVTAMGVRPVARSPLRYVARLFLRSPVDLPWPLNAFERRLRQVFGIGSLGSLPDSSVDDQ